MVPSGIDGAQVLAPGAWEESGFTALVVSLIPPTLYRMRLATMAVLRGPATV